MEKLVQPLEQVHVNLLKKQPWYASWHQNKLNQPAHWIIFLAIGIFLTSIVTSRILGLNNLSSSAAEVSSVSGIVGPSANCDYYASPTGTSGGDGSSVNAWDLHTALSKTAEITAGKTLCLKGGTYIGRYASNLAGTANSPVVIRSAPGEWAKIDGNYSTTLTADFGINDTVVQVSDVSGLPSANEVFGFIIDNEILRIYGRTGNTLTVYDRRAVGAPNGPANHSAGAAGLVSTPIFAINGAYTMVRDFEITNSDPDRINLDAERGAGINTVVVGTKIINMVIHDVGHPGIGFWEQVGDGGEIYGSLVWGVGIYDHDGTWTRGSALYTQNRDGTRYIRDNIWFRNFTGGVSIFTTNGYANGFHVEGNISFDHRNSQNFWAGSQNINPIERLKMISNYGYHRGPYSVDSQTDFGIGYTTANTDAEVRDNRMVSNNVTFGSSKFANLIFTGNTVYLRPGSAQAQVNIDQETRQNYTINNNRYYGDDRFTSAQACSCIMDFVTWKQQTGFDLNSTYTSTAPPDEYFVRPNLYQTGRANIAVYNWSGASSVSVDISNAGLANGQTYEIRDAQNFFAAPIVTGTYNGSNVTIPMNLTQVANLVGNITHIPNVNQHTAPEFGAFVLLPTSASTPPADTTPPVLSSGSPSGSLTAGTTTVAMTLSTNETATCKYGTTPGVAYASIANTFTTTNSTSHSKTLTGLTNGSSYTYYIRCQDTASNANTSDYTISFNVASPTTSPTIGLNPSALSFSGVSGGSTPASKTSVITNTGSGTLNWTATPDQDWCHIAPVSGQLAASASITATVSVNSPSNEGTFTCNVSVAASGATNTPQAIVVTYSVTAAADTTPPTVSLTAPTGGATVNGTTTTVSANASDNIGVASVQFKLDGANLGTEDTSSPFSSVWNTTLVSNGSHTLTATARDAAGNSTTSAPVTVTVSNQASTGPAPVISSFSLSSKTQTTATIQWKTNIPATGSISYGTNRNSLNLSAPETTTPVCTSTGCTHSLTLTGLTRSTTYYYRITATNNNASTTSIRSSFKTRR